MSPLPIKAIEKTVYINGCRLSKREHNIPPSCRAIRRLGSPSAPTERLVNLKWYTALKANEILHRRGALWQHESYDHLLRDAEALERILQYILNNPVKAGLVKDRRDWKWHYRKPRK
jgi:hypothetical protein